jgi:polyphosphate kinase 2 (PPK2 family)
MADTHSTQTPSEKEVRKVAERFRIDTGKHFALKDHPTRVDLPGMADDTAAKQALRSGVDRLAKLQEKLYINGRWAVLIVFQAMDAGGKDSTIKHVMSGVNPQGVHVTSFKPPGPDELAHDFLWRVSKVLPARGMIGIFNRSHYEEVLVPRVKPKLLEPQHLPAKIAIDGRISCRPMTRRSPRRRPSTRRGT